MAALTHHAFPLSPVTGKQADTIIGLARAFGTTGENTKEVSLIAADAVSHSLQVSIGGTAYRITETLGWGADGLVFKAIDTDSKAQVALKVSKPFAPADASLTHGRLGKSGFWNEFYARQIIGEQIPGVATGIAQAVFTDGSGHFCGVQASPYIDGMKADLWLKKAIHTGDIKQVETFLQSALDTLLQLRQHGLWADDVGLDNWMVRQGANTPTLVDLGALRIEEEAEDIDLSDALNALQESVESALDQSSGLSDEMESVLIEFAEKIDGLCSEQDISNLSLPG